MTKGRQGVEISAAISRSAIESPAVRKTDRLTSVQRSANDPVVFGCAAVIAVIGFPVTQEVTASPGRRGE